VSIDKLKKQLRAEKTKNVDKVTMSSDLESLFVQSVEEVRKDIVKRRLKEEVAVRSGPRKNDS
jgi:hypothetical protein